MASSKNNKISAPVIQRLPRYYRMVSELEEAGVTRISSRELAERMGLTAAQIRQDLSCFGGFGQQGYGYTVPLLREEFRSILGLDHRYRAILLGAGNLGRAIAYHIPFELEGYVLVGIFDRSPALIGTRICDWIIRPETDLESFCAAYHPDMAILCVPTGSAPALVDRLLRAGVRNFWNLSHYDFSVTHPEATVENVHLNDSLMTLCYRMANRAEP